MQKEIEEKEKEAKIPTKDQIALRLETLPSVIMDNELKQLDIEDEIGILEVEEKAIDNRVSMLVATEKEMIKPTEEPKLKYRNEMAREAAKQGRLKNDTGFIGVREKINKKTKELKEKKIEYFFMDRRFKAAKVFAVMMTPNIVKLEGVDKNV